MPRVRYAAVTGYDLYVAVDILYMLLYHLYALLVCCTGRTVKVDRDGQYESIKLNGPTATDALAASAAL